MLVLVLVLVLVLLVLLVLLLLLLLLLLVLLVRASSGMQEARGGGLNTGIGSRMARGRGPGQPEACGRGGRGG